MAGTGATMESIKNSSLIPKFEKVTRFALNKQTNVARLATKSNMKPTGRTFQFPINNRRPMSGTSLPPGTGTVPSPATSRNVFARIFPGDRFSALSQDWVTKYYSQDNGSVMPEIEEQDMMLLIENEKLERERMFCAPSQGTLVPEYATVTITQVTPVLTFTVNDPDLVCYFADGRRFELWSCTGSGATPSLVANTATKRPTPTEGYYTVDSTAENAAGTLFTVTCVEPSAGGLTVNDTTHCPAADEAIQEDWNPTGPVNAFTEWHSIDTIISNQNQVTLHTTHDTLPADATFQGLATGGVWSSPTFTSSGGTLDRSLIERAGNLILTRGGGDPNKLRNIIAHPFQIEKHIASLQAAERYNNTGKPQQFTSGTQWTYDGDLGPMIGDRQTVKARFLRKDAVFLMGPDIHTYQVAEWHFVPGHDGVWYHDPTNRPADRATALEIGNFGCDLRNTSVAIRGLATS